jgi:transcriptional regulator with XRE-family HTH domain
MSNEYEKNDLGRYVRRVMKQKGLTLREIEMRSEGRITDGYISSIINGGPKNLTVEKIKALADGLSVDALELFEVACVGSQGSARGKAQVDPSHSLMILRLMQEVAVSEELTELLQEAVQLPPEDRHMVLRTIRALNEAKSAGSRSRRAL